METKPENKKPEKCPHCGSEDIKTEKRGDLMFSRSIGIGKITYVCGQCRKAV
jgi:hypothetical protein